ncbi:MAG: hypothetical protein ACR2HM_08330, partial [Acidimicrobiales bacterium]
AEAQLRKGRAEAAELIELHAALDAGLGMLRAELGEVRSALARIADSKADLEDRLETFVRTSLVPEGETGRKAKKAAESQLTMLAAAVQDLLRQQRLLGDKAAPLEQSSDAAAAAAARAVAQASSLGPIRSDMKLVHQEVAEQNEALEALRRTVETLRQGGPATRAPVKKAPVKKAAAAKTAAAAKRAPRAKKA